jgi:SOS-response transcriptional repressor LexA
MRSIKKLLVLEYKLQQVRGLMDFNLIRKKVVVFLAERNLNQTWLANQLGSDQPLISQWLSGKRVPRKSNIAKLMNLLKSHGVDFAAPVLEIAEETAMRYNASSSAGGAINSPLADLIQIPILSSVKNLDAQNPNPAFIAGSIYYPRYEMVTEYPGVKFAVKMKDASMEPTISRGTTCFISPATELAAGKIMLFFNKKNSGYLIGKVAQQGGKYTITFTNISVDAIVFDKNVYEVVGEVKACINKLSN